jgi:hypothetical protein
MGLAGVAVALDVIVLAGVVVLVGLAALLERTRPSSRSVASVPVHWTGLAALSFVAGTGAVSLEMVACSVAGLPFHVLPIVLPWVAALAALLLWPAARGTAVTILSARPQGSSPPLSAVDACLAILVAGQVAYACVFALAVPIRGWDAWELWFLKARIFYEHRALSMDFPPGVSFEDYPLHLPLVLTWVYVAAGEIHDRWGKVLYVLQFSSLLLAFNALARFMCSRTHALLFTAILSSLPDLDKHGDV